MSVTNQNVVKYKLAHVRIKGMDIIIIPLDASFADRRSEEKSDVFNTFQRYATGANLKGMVVLVWDCGGGKMAYLSAKQAHPYLHGLSLPTVYKNLNKELAVKNTGPAAESFIRLATPPGGHEEAPQASASRIADDREQRSEQSNSARQTARAPENSLDDRGKVAAFQRRHRIGLVTLLFTDMVGSTKLKQELGDVEAVQLMQKHHGLVRDILARFPGAEEISTAGDSFFIVFAKPSDAVRFSLLMQQAVRRFSEDLSAPVADRIGIHVGEVFIEQVEGSDKVNDLYGIQVDTCARVMSLGNGDQILMTRFAFDNARQVLKGQGVEGIGPLTWKSHGLYDLKGVEEPLEICEVGETDYASLKGPEDSEKVRKHNAPVAPTKPAPPPSTPQMPASRHVVGSSSTSYPVSPIRFSSIKGNNG